MEGSSNSRNDTLMWTDAQVEYLINILLQQSRIPGMKPGGNFKAKAYKAIEQQMVERYETQFTLEKIKNKLKSTKSDYNTCKQILATSGFGWDPTNKCVEVDNEVWADYIQKYPERRKFKGLQKWKHYKDLHELFGNSTATGLHGNNCNSYRMNEDSDAHQTTGTPHTHTPEFDTNVDENMYFTQMLNNDSPIPSPSPVQQESQPTTIGSRTTNSANKRKRSNTFDERYGTFLEKISDNFERLMDTSTIEIMNKSAVILREMLESGDIDDDMHLRALMLMEQGNKPITFLNLKPTERVRWLILNINHQYYTSATIMLSDEERRQLAVKMMYVLVITFYRFLHRRRQIVHPFRNAGSEFVHNIINGHPRNCLDLLRMDRNSFITLCNILKEKNLVEDGRDINVEEQVAIFLLTVGHNERNRACQNTFQHSGQTISKYVNIIIRALCQLGKEYISRPNDETPSKIRLNPRFNPYFKDCLRALDGTHIPVWVRTSEQSRFRNRKGTLSQNVFAVVGFDMRFHYVFADWEGSATDSRVLYSALDTENHPFVIPAGKYYLGDGGYPNIRGLLTPYRGHRYHLSEYNAPGARRVTSAEDLFNHRHSSLRTTVERAFALLKGRFPILKAQVSFPYIVQVGIVLATCVLHNFIIDHNPHAEQFDENEGATDDANDSTSFISEVETATQSIHRGSNNDLRTSITSQMFLDFQNRNRS